MSKGKKERAQETAPNEFFNLVAEFAEGLEAVKPSIKTIFKTESSKVDLETKVWHHYHKVAAVSYHCQNVKRSAAAMKEQLMNILSKMADRPVGTQSEFRVAIQDRNIIYEVDAFFAALQSALDFLGSVVSRYIRGKETDEFDKLPKFLQHSNHPVAALVNQAWTEWVGDCTYYRDYLVHRGALPTPFAVYADVVASGLSDEALAGLVTRAVDAKGKPVVFPLPVKPNPRVRITLSDMLRSHRESPPEGVVETVTTISFSSKEKGTGPKVGVSVGKSVRGVWTSFSSESSLGESPGQLRFVRYDLAPGYIEAEDLCQNLYTKLVSLASAVFSELVKTGFVHVA